MARVADTALGSADAPIVWPKQNEFLGFDEPQFTELRNGSVLMSLRLDAAGARQWLGVWSQLRRAARDAQLPRRTKWLPLKLVAKKSHDQQEEETEAREQEPRRNAGVRWERRREAEHDEAITKGGGNRGDRPS